MISNFLTQLKTKSFWQNLFLYLLGMIFIGMGAVLTVNSNAGAGGYDALTFVLSDIWSVPVSFSIYFIAIISVLITALIRRRFPRLTTFITAFILGNIVDFFRSYLQIFQGRDFISQILILSIGLIFIGFGVAAYLISKFPANPIDDYVLALNEKKIPLHYAKLSFDIPCFVLAYLLGGKIGWGSLVITLVLGPLIQIWTQILNTIFKRLEKNVSS